MAESSVTCPGCGMELKAPNEDDLAKAVQEHSKHAHGMEISKEQAKQQLKEMLAGQSGD